VLKTYTDPKNLHGVKNPVVTVGTFDGVHLGHSKILQRLCKLADEVGGESVLLTFEPHPRIALKKDHLSLRLLNTPEEKLRILEQSCIRHVVVITFTEEFARLDEHDFIREYLVNKLQVSRLVVGYDHHFGRNRGGNFASLKDYADKYNFQVEEMPRLDVDEHAVSSTQIRNALMQGEIAQANKMLGYLYPLQGKVAEGEKVGRKIGFPTANLEVQYPYKLIPAHGVYAVRIIADKNIFNGMCNIGTRPTFDGTKETIETNIFDFNEDLYGKDIRLLFVQKLRDEKKFDGVDKLIEQLNTDRGNALKILQGSNDKS
jgi:riboflavin kinase / FMN adenylyltransferase